MPGRNRGSPIKEAKHDVTHEPNEPSAETSNHGKWLNSLRVSASKEVKAIVAENPHAYTAKQVASNIDELLAEQPSSHESALDNIASGREEHLRLIKLLEDAELMLKDVQDFQASREAEEQFSKEAKTWLKTEKEKAREVMEDTNARANVHVEKGALQFAKRCSL